MKCKGRSRRTQLPCKKDARIGREFCELHGGNSRKGIASGQFKHGRYSKDLPTRLLAEYDLTRNDPKLLELKDEIALIHSRAVDLIKRVDSGESGHLWQLLAKTFADLEEAIRAKDTVTIGAALTEMQRLIVRGTEDYHAWEEVTKQIDRKQRLVESERKRAVELQQFVTVEQFMLYASVYTDAIRQIITDQQQLARLQQLLAIRFRERGVNVVGALEPTTDPDAITH